MQVESMWALEITRESFDSSEIWSAEAMGPSLSRITASGRSAARSPRRCDRPRESSDSLDSHLESPEVLACSTAQPR